MPCTRSCAEGESSWTVVVPGIRWRNCEICAVKRGSFHRIHGGNEVVVCCIAFDALYQSSCKGSIDAVPDGDWGGGEGGAVSLDHESAVA